MFETVTVQEALKEGRKKLVYTPIVIFFTGIAAITTIVALELVKPIAFLPGIVGMIILSWLYWSMNVVSWKIWAFENVRNVHQLMDYAVQDKLIWKEGHFLNRTERWNDQQRSAWAEIEKKFSKADVFTDDFSIGQESLIGYSRPQAIFLIVFGFLFVGAGLYAAITIDSNENPMIRFLPGTLGFVFVGLGSYRLIKNAPVIIINKEGIKHKEAFYSWEHISEEKAIRKQRGKNSANYLIFLFGQEEKEIGINEFNVNKEEMRQILYVHRNRSAFPKAH